MVKVLTVLAFVISVHQSFSQTFVKDTIYITNGNMSHLIFTDEPEHTDFGSGYIASQSDGTPAIKKVGKNWLIMVKAKKEFKRHTNISVVTKSDVYYDITCYYSKEAVKNFVVFDYDNKIKTDKTKEVELSYEDEDEEVISAKIKDSLLEVERQVFYLDSVRYKGQSKQLYSSNSKNIKRVGSRNGDIRLNMVGTYARKDKIYLKFNIYNGGSLPFDIDKWDFFYANSTNYNAETASRKSVEAKYEYNTKYQSIIPKNSQTKVFVFDDFSINNKQRFYVQLFEKNGERDILLSIPSSLINKAKVIKERYK